MLDQLRLKNFRCHRDLTVNFTRGVNGIVGKNGSGKSVVGVEAVKFLFTGKLDDTKEAVITLGQSSGYVEGRLTIDDKPAVLKRYLGESKVSLEYDGKKYSKAGEVKDLWASLFQIDATIFTNVIIASQGEIPLLFSGDQADRERIFQKLFMVPPTDKIRLSIWNDYIKDAPPEFPSETQDTLEELRRNIETLQREADEGKTAIQAIEGQLLTDAQYQDACARSAFLRCCITDESRSAELAVSVERAKAEVRRLTGIKTDLLTTINGTDYSALVKEAQKMETAKGNLEKRTAILAELGELVAKEATNASARKKAKQDIAGIQATLEEIASIRAVMDTDITRSLEKIAKLKSVREVAECPTCSQPIKDIEKLLGELSRSAEENQRKKKEADALLASLAKDKAALEETIELFERTKRDADRLTSRLAEYPEAEYDAKDHAQLKQRIADYDHDAKILKLTDIDLTKAQAILTDARDKLQALAKYNGKTTAAQELAEVEALLNEHTNNAAAIAQAGLIVREKEVQIEGLRTRIQNSERYTEMNQKRNDYLNCLQKVYDLFHTSQFPRRLIASYASEVEAGLTRNLSQFNLPFYVRVDEAFKINVFDEEGRLLPRVSGGQAVIIGLCLRFALHALFSQSFPMLIIDEGSAALDEEENKPLYFEMIRNMGKESNIQQIIIIDHDERLLDVVDNMIKL